MSKRKQHKPEFKTKVALDAEIGEFALVIGKRPMSTALDGSEFIGPVSSSTAPGRRGG